MRRGLRAAGGGLLVGVALVATACTGKNAVDQSGSDFRYVGSAKVGTVYSVAKRKPAGNFTVPSLTGSGSTELSSLRGKVVLINYWATWCPPCIGEAPQLDLVYREYKAKDVVFLGIDTKDTRQKAQDFVKNNDISYPTGFDATGQTALQIGKVPTVALPTSVLIDKNGKVAAVYTARLSPVDIKPVLNKLLAGN